MSSLPLVESHPNAVPITAVTQSGLKQWRATQPRAVQSWLDAMDFAGEAGEFCLIADSGSLARVVLGLGDGPDCWASGRLGRQLPAGAYRIDWCVGIADGDKTSAMNWLALAWALGAYKFERYKSKPVDSAALLVWPDGCDRPYVEGAANAALLTRDLINTPAEDMGPADLQATAEQVASAHSGQVTSIVGDDLLTSNLPAIHAVGRAADFAPRLIDLIWGEASHPKITLVGKGVCFDSGGLDIKPSNGMRLMKKDMGGAATVLGLADWIMRAKLKVRLRVLIPAVENAISGNAFRPGDVVPTRKGPTIEVGNTDAEGRVVLADALAVACEEDPDLVVDCATLTGAARVALGPELPAMFSPDEELAADLLAAGTAQNDPMWRLPLWPGYRKMIDSKVADISNSGDSGLAGAITAALFLKTFVTEDTPWVHLDLFGWNPDDKPGRPVGGEAYAQRALFEVIKQRSAEA